MMSASSRWAPRLTLALLLLSVGCTASRPTDDLQRLLQPAAWTADVQPEAPALPAIELERAIHDEVNRVRLTKGLPALTWLPPLRTVSAEHSQHMAEAPFFGHTNPQGEDPSARARRHGLVPIQQTGQYTLEGVGENLYLTHRYHEVRIYHDTEHYEADWKTIDQLATEAVEAWLQSPTHRANLLSPHYRGQGIGVMIGANHTVYITQNLSPCEVGVMALAR